MESIHQQEHDAASLGPKSAGADPQPLGPSREVLRVPDRPRIYLPVQVHFLDRLDHLLRLRAMVTPDQAQPWEVESLKRAIYATLRDCIEVGVGDEARARLQMASTPMN